MEDQERDVASPANGAHQVKGKTPRPSDLTVMILGKVGKSRSFKISSRIFFWACLFFAAYIITSVLVFNGYFSELRSNRSQQALLDQLQQEIKDTKKGLHISKQHLILLEEAVYEMSAGREKPAKMTMPETAAPKKAESSVEAAPVERIEKTSDVQVPDIVDIKDLEIRREETMLKINFKLVNIHQDEAPVSGYVYVIAMNKDNEPPYLWTYPKVALKNGLPVDYKRGQLFFIKRFKTIRGEYSINSETEYPSAVKVIVYDHPGTLIFQKEFEVEKAP
jgi:hypothetical protein